MKLTKISYYIISVYNILCYKYCIEIINMFKKM